MTNFLLSAEMDLPAAGISIQPLGRDAVFFFGPIELVMAGARGIRQVGDMLEKLYLGAHNERAQITYDGSDPLSPAGTVTFVRRLDGIEITKNNSTTCMRDAITRLVIRRLAQLARASGRPS